MMTLEQYEQLPDTGVRTELVDGEVFELAAGTFRHNFMRDQARSRLQSEAGGLAAVEVEFRTRPSRVRRADVAWFRRLASEDWNLHIMPVPDLVAEVVSPSDSANEIRAKVHEYLDAGVTTVWVIYLDAGEAGIWNRGGQCHMGVRVLTADCLPGFSLSIDTVYGTASAPPAQ